MKASVVCLSRRGTHSVYVLVPSLGVDGACVSWVPSTLVSLNVMQESHG